MNAWDLLTDSKLGSAASIVGFLLTLIGFTMTLWTIRRTRTAAEAARSAAESVQRDLLRFDAVQDLASAIAALEEIKRLLRSRALAVLPDRYQTLRKHLISIHGSFPDLTDKQRSQLQNAILQFRSAENRLENPCDGDDAEKTIERLSRIAAQELDSLHAVLVAIRVAKGK